MVKYIPIIGTISSGKSTFLQGFLGTDVLQSGSTTTTKFICFIKHNNKETKFYHVLPKLDNGLSFIKDGEEIIGNDEISKKVVEINEKLSKKEEINEKLSKENNIKKDIFYVLETQIKNIENIYLLENCWFMDIPGLNERETNYIEDIFSLITFDKILFEIIIFDSTSIGSDNILKIFNELDKKKCLKKKGNIYILNKIDQCTSNGNGEIIECFQQYFYETFEDDKNEKSFLKINFYENYFIPLNSLLYKAETKIKNDFLSMLIFELFSYLEHNSKDEALSYYEYIQKRMKLIVENNKLEIEDKLDKSKDDDIQKIIEDFIKVVEKVNKNDSFQLGINTKKKDILKGLKKIYKIHKEKKWQIYHSESFNKLQLIIENINNANELITELLDSPAAPCPPNPEKSEKKNSINNISDKIIKLEDNYLNIVNDLDNFLNKFLKIIDGNNELKNYRMCLKNIKENIIGRKIRISFIGNISVGKSTILNCIIGSEILPTKESECTYRGVILRHKENQNFKLYKTKLVTKGSGLDKYYYFIDDQKPYCVGINNIKAHLNNKNNDKKMNDSDAFIVVTGHLKIFDFIKLDNKIKNKIEFIDLPGHDRKNNVFNENEYYSRILTFSNSCIYINDPKSIDDEDSVRRMLDQYLSDKAKVFINLRPKFNKTCLFLINKVDTLESEEDKLKIANNIYKNIKNVEPDITQNDLNISFVSGKKFYYFLKLHYDYVEKLIINNYLLIHSLYRKWSNCLFSLNFYKFLSKEFEKIEENLDIDLDEEEIEIPEVFINEILKSFNLVFKDNLIYFRDINEEKKFASKFYKLRYLIQKTDFNNTNYSKEFLYKIKNIIIDSEIIQKENFKLSLKNFFKFSDQIFEKQISQEIEQIKLDNKNQYDLLKNHILPKIKDLFKYKEDNIKRIINDGRHKIIGLIESEIKNINERLESAGKNVEEAGSILQKKIQEILDKTNEDNEKEIKLLNEEIEKDLKEAISNFYEIKGINIDKINTNIGLTTKMVFSFIGSVFSGIAVRTGLVLFGQSLLAGATVIAGQAPITAAIGGFLMGPVGIGVGFVVGIGISLTTLLVHWFKKDKRYKKGLEEMKKKINEKMDENEKNFMSDFEVFKEAFYKEFDVMLETLLFNIEHIDEKKWKKLKIAYNEKKKEIQKRIADFNNKI